MLPGFRFLFAAIVLTISTLIFGLGAAALLRASHEQFASLPAMPSAPALPPAATADASPHDAAPPTLALLRIDTPDLAAVPAPRPMPPVTDQAAPAPEAKEAIAAPPPPDLAASEPKPAAAAATTTSEPSKTADEITTDRVETAATTSAAPQTPQDAPEAAVTRPEAPRPAPAAIPTDIAKAEPAQAQPLEAQPVQAQPAQAETVRQAGRTQPEPAKVQAAKAEPAAPRVPEVALTNEPRPAPLEPADAPIKTAMLAPTEPAPSAAADPAVAITGPIPLPRSREWALAQSHAAHRQAARKRTAAVRARPRAVVRQPASPQPQAPASAPNLLFPFGQ